MKKKLYTIIFEADTRAGKLFDVLLIVSIVLSVAAVMLESVKSIQVHFGDELFAIEWIFTILFTIEYFFRIYAVRKARKYIFSFFGIVDLLAILPSYISIFIPGTHVLLIIRILRVLRVFRVLKFVQYISSAEMLAQALKNSRRKITVFLATVLTLVVILGSFMYLIEGEQHGFTSIPKSIYWAIVTLTTVGYGDISPQTPIGQALASVIMIIGYGIIAVPTGIVTVEMAQLGRSDFENSVLCPSCSKKGHTADAQFCKHCGAKLA